MSKYRERWEEEYVSPPGAERGGEFDFERRHVIEAATAGYDWCEGCDSWSPEGFCVDSICICYSRCW